MAVDVPHMFVDRLFHHVQNASDEYGLYPELAFGAVVEFLFQQVVGVVVLGCREQFHQQCSGNDEEHILVSFQGFQYVARCLARVFICFVMSHLFYRLANPCGVSRVSSTLQRYTTLMSGSQFFLHSFATCMDKSAGNGQIGGAVQIFVQ